MRKESEKRILCICIGFPGGSDGKESACSVRDLGSIPGLEKSPRIGNGSPIQYSCLENCMDREAWRATVIKLQRDRYNRAANTHVYV